MGARRRCLALFSVFIGLAAVPGAIQDPNAAARSPILVITSTANPFTTYYAEILRAEGLNEFAVRDISTIDRTALQASDVAILGQMALTAPQAAMLQEWVDNDGGNLIAMRPDPQLYGVLGLTAPAAATLSDSYLRFEPVRAATGLVTEAMQYHGDADLVDVDALHLSYIVAALYSTSATRTTHPAVTVRDSATAGHAVAFMYDLARSVVYTRQGNPAWAGQERDGTSPIRSDDLFYGAKPDDMQRDWVDLSKVAIPQADEQQRLLANLILDINASKRPLPRFWYLPRAGKAVVVMTGDDHGFGGTAGRFDRYTLQSPAQCSVDDWQCVRGTSYIYTNPNLTDAQAAAYEAQGFEVALHVTTDCADWTPVILAESYALQLTEFAAAYPHVAAPRTNRMHCVAWSDYDTQPQVELAHNIRFDTSYYYWPVSWVKDRPGFFTGSGFPMRFAKADGTLIDVYQAASQMTDESGQLYPHTIEALLDRALGGEAYYGVFTANMHTDFNESNADGKNSLANSDAIVAAAQQRGVPIVAARQMAQWLDGRNGSVFSLNSWDGTTLGFSVSAAQGANGLTAMLPLRSGGLKLADLTRAGVRVSYAIERIKGVEYALFSAVASSYSASYIVDSTPPAISNIVAVATGPTTAIVTWNTDEPATSHIDIGTAAASLHPALSDGSFITSHRLTLTGLTAETTYFFRVTSADGSIPANTITEPASAASFTTLPEPPPSFVDTTVADFSAGMTSSSAYISEVANGEVMLRPVVGTEFGAAALPSDWFVQPWAVGGSASAAAGTLTVDAALVGQNALYGPGRSLEFVATFSDEFQHIGFGTDFIAGPWAIFSSDVSQVYARTDLGGGDSCPVAGPQCTPLGPRVFGSPHRFRIEWQADRVTYFVDGAQVASHATRIAAPMRPLAASDHTLGGGVLVNDWFHMSPYSASGELVSRVFDAGAATNNWGALSWTAALPPSTAIAFSVRTGNTPVPDASWTPYRALPASGAPIGGASRYLQYRAVLSTTDAASTPELQEVSVQYHAMVATTDSSP